MRNIRPILYIVALFACSAAAHAQTKYQTCAFSDPTHCYGIGPGNTGQAYTSNGSSSYPSFSSSLSAVTSVNGVTIPATSSTVLTSPTTTTPNLCQLSTSTAGLGQWGTCGLTPPGGTSGQIQYNNSGVFGGISTTGTGDVVLATSATLSSPILTTPNLGTPSAINLANATFPSSISAITTLPSLTSANGITIPATSSTALTSPTTTTPGLCQESTSTAGLGQWATCPGSGAGTVTSVALAMPSGFAVSGTPITSSGTLSVAMSVAGVLKAYGGGVSAAVASDIYGLWSGTCSSSTFLRGDGACVAVSGAPGGSSGQIQYNSGGLFAGAPGFTANANGQISINPTGGEAFQIQGVANNPVTAFQSANSATTALPDFYFLRLGSTANAYEEGPNIVIQDVSNSDITEIQQSGGQTEIWQNDGTPTQVQYFDSTYGPHFPTVPSSTAAQSGYLCYSTTTGAVTYDPTNNCLGGSGGAPGGSNFELQYNNSGAFGGIAVGTSGQALISGGSSGAPAFGALNLSFTTGTLATSELPAFSGDVTSTAGSASLTVSKVSGSAGTPTTITTYNATSGSIEISPPTGALGTINLTLPDVTGILPAITGTITTGDCAKFASATSITDSGAACGSGSMVYPGAGIAVSTGTAWGTSINGGSNTIVGNAGSGQAALIPAQAIQVLDNGTPNTTGCTGSGYTFVIGDANSTVDCTGAAQTVTLPANSSVAFSSNVLLTVQTADGASPATLTPASGVTICSAQYGCSTTQTYAVPADSFIQIQQSATTDTWSVIKWDTPVSVSGGSYTLSGTCTTSAHTGNAVAGTVTLSSAGGCTVILTFTGVQPPADGFVGRMSDQTQSGPTSYLYPWGQSASTTSSITFSVPGAAASGDVLSFGPIAGY